MTEADAGAVSALILRSCDQVLVQYHSPELIVRFRQHATPESLSEQLGRKEAFVIEDGERIVATGGLAWFDDPDRPREEQAGVYEATAADRRVSNLFVAVDLLGNGIGRTLLDHLVRLAEAEGAQRLRVASSRNAVSFYERAGFALDPDPPSEIPEITWLVRTL